MLYLVKFIHGLWRATLASNLNKRDKAEILRFVIFYFYIT